MTSNFHLSNMISVLFSMSFKIFIKYIPCSRNLPEQLPSRVKIIKQWHCSLCFPGPSHRKDSNWTVYQLTFFLFWCLGKTNKQKKNKNSYPEVPGNSHSLSKTWLRFLLSAIKMQLYPKSVCILWILVWMCHGLTQGQNLLKHRKRSSLQF